MAMGSTSSPSTWTSINLVPNENQHLHGVKIDALQVDGAGIHVDRRAVRISLSRHLMQSSGGEVNMSRV